MHEVGGLCGNKDALHVRSEPRFLCSSYCTSPNALPSVKFQSWIFTCFDWLEKRNALRNTWGAVTQSKDASYYEGTSDLSLHATMMLSLD